MAFFLPFSKGENWNIKQNNDFDKHSKWISGGPLKKKIFLVWELIKFNLRLLNYITESIYYITDEYLIKIDTFQVVIFFFKVQDCSYLCSLLCPTHTRPPCLGEGLLQDRWRTSKPISQLVLHWPQDDQGVHPPFLQKKKKEKNSEHQWILARSDG